MVEDHRQAMVIHVVLRNAHPLVGYGQEDKSTDEHGDIRPLNIFVAIINPTLIVCFVSCVHVFLGFFVWHPSNDQPE